MTSSTARPTWSTARCRPTPCTRRTTLTLTPNPNSNQVQANTMDEEDEDALSPHSPLVLCPSTFAPGKKGRFRKPHVV